MKIDKSFCDNCGKEDLTKCLPIELNCGFGSIFDDLVLDFCSDECCVEFIQSKLKETKEKKFYTLPLRDEFKTKLNKLMEKAKK